MSKPARARCVTIRPARVRYIKLGEGGRWDKESLERGIIRFGFGTSKPERFALSNAINWEQLTISFISDGKDKGTATRFTNETKIFFDDNGSTLRITFMAERL